MTPNSSAEREPEGTVSTGAGETDGDDENSVSTYEWAGGVIAGLGVFLTPLVTAPVAAYCAYRIWHVKRVSALLILALVVGTVVFWWIVLFSVLA